MLLLLIGLLKLSALDGTRLRPAAEPPPARFALFPSSDGEQKKKTKNKQTKKQKKTDGSRRERPHSSVSAFGRK
jgi:hypothetical protein